MKFLLVVFRASVPADTRFLSVILFAVISLEATCCHKNDRRHLRSAGRCWKAGRKEKEKEYRDKTESPETIAVSGLLLVRVARLELTTP